MFVPSKDDAQRYRVPAANLQTDLTTGMEGAISAEGLASDATAGEGAADGDCLDAEAAADFAAVFERGVAADAWPPPAAAADGVPDDAKVGVSDGEAREEDMPVRRAMWPQRRSISIRRCSSSGSIRPSLMA